MSDAMRMVGITDWPTLLVIVGLTIVTVITRSLFFITARPLALSPWLQCCLHYTPVAALAALVIPEIIMLPSGHITAWTDARLYAALAGAVCYFWWRNVMSTIAAGMAVYLPLHVGLGW